MVKQGAEWRTAHQDLRGEAGGWWVCWDLCHREPAATEPRAHPHPALPAAPPIPGLTHAQLSQQLPELRLGLPAL